MKGMGRCALFALEDVINVNGAQNISIAYEINRQEGVYLSTTKNHQAQGRFFQMTQSSNPSS